MTLIGSVLVLAGLFFLAVGTVGILRLPDVFSRAHALGVTDTLGVVLMIGGFIWEQGFSLTTTKLLFILAFLSLFNPVIAHATLRAAWRSGLKPWTQDSRDLRR